MIEARLFSIGMGRTANPDSITQIARKADERIGQIQGIFAPLPGRMPPPEAAPPQRYAARQCAVWTYDVGWGKVASQGFPGARVSRRPVGESRGEAIVNTACKTKKNTYSSR